ncbi:NUDIX domain-containing protein [Caulobacter sp. KR2-114]|uniref:NUDIX domain-containing protein n=1 Tax=Caulobacter sp. KR2-114 TaxID=3400912 RepID=UPI003C078C39
MTQVVSVRLAREGYIRIHVVTLQEADGARHDREVEDHGRSACVLPYDAARKVALMVRLPRTPLLLAGEPEPLFEAPAGMIDGDEAPDETIRREAMEEAGLALTALEPVARVWCSPGVSAERSSLFLAPYAAADRVAEGGGLAEEHEHIQVVELPLAELWRKVEAGEIEDLKTLALSLALHARHPELF